MIPNWLLLSGGIALLILLALIAFMPWRRKGQHDYSTSLEQIQRQQTEARAADMSLSSSLQQELEGLLAQNQKLHAIKLYRQRTGCGLREAKAAVESIERGQTSFQTPANLYPSATNQFIGDDFNTEIRRLVLEGKKINAIKLYRERTGCGLREAKEAVDRMG